MTQAIGAAEGPVIQPGVTPPGGIPGHTPPRYFIGRAQNRSTFLADVLEGLTHRPRFIPPKYFFDEQGANLFNQVRSSPEHYLGRSEDAILGAMGEDLGGRVDRGLCLVEYGAGFPEGTRHIVKSLHEPTAYVAVDLSRRQAVRAARTIWQEFPHLAVSAVCADITCTFDLPSDVKPNPKLGYFPGSKIGGLHAEYAVQPLRRARAQLGNGACLLAGVDLVKDPAMFRAAFNDSFGAVAAFNLNLLGRMKRELGAQLEIADFVHRADFDPIKCRIELHLSARRETAIGIGANVFTFASGESINTGNAHKYTDEAFSSIAAEAGFEREKAWHDDQRLFGVHLLRAV